MRVEAAGRTGGGGGGYARGARVLSVGIGVTGLVTFAYFSLASYALSDAEYGPIALLWSVMFVVVSVFYRPVEQLLQRSVARARARGESVSLRGPLLLQGSFAATFLAVALALRGPIRDDVFGGSGELYWVLVCGVVFYAASYFARGFFAGSGRFALYGGLVLLEASSRCLFALAVVIGITSGQSAVALGMAAAPLVSLFVVPFALGRRERSAGPVAAGSAREGGRFAATVFAVQLAEQTLINAAVITAYGTAGNRVAAGVVFNALLIARAPLQLFQAIQGSLLPALASAEALADAAAFRRAVRVTVLAICGFAGLVALGLLVLGPFAMDLLFEDAVTYGRFGLALVAVGMGFHLIAGTLNQAGLARGRTGAVAAAWLSAAVAFVVWMLLPVIDDELLRAEVGYAGAAALLCGLLVASGVARAPAGEALTR